MLLISSLVILGISFAYSFRKDEPDKKILFYLYLLHCGFFVIVFNSSGVSNLFATFYSLTTILWFFQTRLALGYFRMKREEEQKEANERSVHKYNASSDELFLDSKYFIFGIDFNNRVVYIEDKINKISKKFEDPRPLKIVSEEGLDSVSLDFFIGEDRVIERIHVKGINQNLKTHIQEAIVKANAWGEEIKGKWVNYDACWDRFYEYCRQNDIDPKESFFRFTYKNTWHFNTGLLVGKSGSGFIYQDDTFITVSWINSKAELYRDNIEIAFDDEDYRARFLKERRFSINFNKHEVNVEWADRINIISGSKKKAKVSKGSDEISDLITPKK